MSPSPQLTMGSLPCGRKKLGLSLPKSELQGGVPAAQDLTQGGADDSGCPGGRSHRDGDGRPEPGEERPLSSLTVQSRQENEAEQAREQPEADCGWQGRERPQGRAEGQGLPQEPLGQWPPQACTDHPARLAWHRPSWWPGPRSAVTPPAVRHPEQAMAQPEADMALAP